MTRKRLTVNLPTDLLEQLRNTAYWSPGVTLAELVERGIRETLGNVERTHGGPFPMRLAELKGGRPRRRINECESPQRVQLRSPRRFIPVQASAAADSRYTY